jgi:hypothetical protein
VDQLHRDGDVTLQLLVFIDQISSRRGEDVVIQQLPNWHAGSQHAPELHTNPDSQTLPQAPQL